MSETTEDERNAASPVAARTGDETVGFASPVGLLGLGRLGLPIALRLAERYALLACDIDPVRLALFVEQVGTSAHAHTTAVAIEVPARCDVIALVLPMEEAGPVLDDLTTSLRPGTLVVDLG